MHAQNGTHRVKRIDSGNHSLLTVGARWAINEIVTRSRIALVGGWLAVALIFLGLGRLGLSLAFAQKNVTPFWPPSGFALAVVLLYGRRFWPGVLLGGFLLTSSTGVAWYTALPVAVGNTFEALAGLALLQRPVAFHPTLDRLRDVGRFISAALLSAIIGACIGAASLYLTGVIAAEHLPSVWATWWTGDAIGMLIITPLFLSVVMQRRPAPPASWLEGAVLIGLVFVVGRFAFRTETPILYAVFPLLIWGAARFKQHGAAGLSFLVSLIAIYYSANDYGPFAVNSDPYSLVYLQSFIGTGAVTALLLAAAVTERDLAAAERVRLAKLEGTREELEAGRRRFAFLAEVGRLLSTSLDVEATLANAAALCVPDLAEKSRAELTERGLRRWSSEIADGPQPRVGQAVPSAALTAMDENRIVATARPARDDEVDFTRAGCLYVPLVSNGLAAFLTLERAQPGYHVAEMDLIEELRRRALFALENAQLYREAQQAVQLRNEFLSVAAHELKTPVTGLRGFAQLALRTLAKPQPDAALLRQALTSVDQQSQKLTALVMQLLDVARIDAGKLRLARKPTDVKALLQGVVAQFGAHEEGASRVRLSAPQAFAADIDPLRVEQIVVNLLSNALRFAPEASPIDVALTAEGGYVRIAVTDSGPGVERDLRERIFERFYQGKSGLATGMGLGLYISREIAELHGGTLEFEAPAGGGSRFMVALPVDGGEHASANPRH